MGMIERVATRMASINCPRSWDEGGPSPMSAAEKDVHRALARAAIEAMREPTAAMVKAGLLFPSEPLDREFDPVIGNDLPVERYKDMIDAALQEA